MRVRTEEVAHWKEKQPKPLTWLWKQTWVVGRLFGFYKTVILRFAATINDKAPKTQKPFKFPLGFDELLRWLMRKKRPEDRMRLIRGYLRDTMRTERYMTKYFGSGQPVPETTDEETAALLSDWKSKLFDEYQCAMIADFFRRWLAQHETQIRQKRAKAAAAERWKKNN